MLEEVPKEQTWNCFEPPRKRFFRYADRQERTEKGYDLISMLPPELVTKILLMLPTADIFRRCALVANRWKSFIFSDIFLRSIVAFEFGQKVTAQYLSSIPNKNSSGLIDLSQLLAFDHIFHGPLFHLNSNLTNIKLFLNAAIAVRTVVESSQFYCKDGYRLVNFSKRIPNSELAFDNLEVPLAIHGPLYCQAQFYMLDSDFKVISAFYLSNNGWYTLKTSHGFRYLVSREVEFRLRFLYPSEVSKVKRQTRIETEKLIDAIRDARFATVTKYINEERTDIDGFGDMRPLVQAAKKGHASTTLNIIKAGANIELSEDDCLTPLGAAVANGHNDCVRLLLNHGANINASEAKPVLLIAVETAKLDTMRYLIRRGANLTVTDLSGKNALHYVAEFFRTIHLKIRNVNQTSAWKFDKDVTSILDLLISGGCDVNAVSNDGLTPLMLACKHADPRLVGWLIERGADVNFKSAAPLTALLVAVSSKLSTGRCKMVETLMEHGASLSLEVADYFEMTPLVVAFSEIESSYDSYDCRLFELLVEKGADVNVSIQKQNLGNGDDSSLLLCSLRYGMTVEAKVIIRAGANVNLANKHGQTPLMLAAKLNDLEIVDLLIEKGAEVNARDLEGRTALFHAAEASASDGAEISYYRRQGVFVPNGSTIVEALLRHGADATLKNNTGLNVIEAMFEKNTKLAHAFKIATLLQQAAK